MFRGRKEWEMRHSTQVKGLRDSFIFGAFLGVQKKDDVLKNRTNESFHRAGSRYRRLRTANTRSPEARDEAKLGYIVSDLGRKQIEVGGKL